MTRGCSEGNRTYEAKGLQVCASITHSPSAVGIKLGCIMCKGMQYEGLHLRIV